MSAFGRRNNNGHGYIMNQQIALPVPYSHGDGHDFTGNGPGSFSFHQPYSSYGTQFSSPYNPQSSLSASTQHFASHYSSGHTTPDQVRLQHPPPQYITQSRYVQSPRYLPLRDALNETEIESQDSANENTMLSEPVMPPLDGFPDVREFDQLMKRYIPTDLQFIPFHDVRRQLYLQTTLSQLCGRPLCKKARQGINPCQKSTEHKNCLDRPERYRHRVCSISVCPFHWPFPSK